MPDPLDRQRVSALVALGAALAWQLYAVVSALRHASAFRSLFAGLGGTLPPVTRYFFASYPYWVILPILFAVLSVDVLRRQNPPLPYFTAVLVASVASALTLHAWLYEAFFAPLFTILEKIG